MTVTDEWQSEGVGTGPRPSRYGIRTGPTCTARRLLLVSREPWVRVSRWQRPSIDIREFCEESAQRIWNAARGDQDGATRARVKGEPWLPATGVCDRTAPADARSGAQAVRHRSRLRPQPHAHAAEPQ